MRCGRPQPTLFGQSDWAEIGGARQGQTRPDWQSQTRSGCYSPEAVFGKDVGEFLARARFGHHRGHRIAPFLIMRGFLVFGGSLLAAVGLDEEKTRWIIGLLENVEPGDAR